MKFNPNDRVRVENTRDWTVSFASAERPGHGILLKPHIATRLTYAEVEAQAQSPGSFFYGTDGLGAYAAVRILDDDVRAAIFGLPIEAANTPQVTLESVRAMLKLSPNNKFKNELVKNIKTTSDKRMFARLVIQAGLDDVTGGAGKKKIIEEYTGFKVSEAESLNAEPPVVTTTAPV